MNYLKYLFLFCLLLSGCRQKETAAIILYEHETYRIVSSSQETTYSSHAPSVATVSATGEVKALTTGKAVIQVQTSKKEDTYHFVIIRPVSSLFQDDSTPYLIAHRGYSALYPENTLPAFIAAGKCEAFCGIETDLQVTKDGTLVCLHAPRVEEMTDGHGRVNHLSDQELKELTIDRGSHIENYPHLRIPIFKEYLKICAQYHKLAVIDLKRLSKRDILRVLEDLETCGMRERCIITSFNTSLLTALRRYDPGIPIMPMYKRMSPSLVQKWSGTKNCLISQKALTIQKSDILRLKDSGILTAAWGVEDAHMMDLLTEYGVKLIICDQPL